MQFIIFAVLAVIAFVFLIVYNFRAAKKADKKDKNNIKPLSQEEVTDYVPERKALSMDSPTQGGNQIIGNQAADNTDQQYRQALRSFAEQNARPQTNEAQPYKTADQDYREALRSMSKQEGE